jgi:hypothetical protein
MGLGRFPEKVSNRRAGGSFSKLIFRIRLGRRGKTQVEFQGRIG